MHAETILRGTQGKRVQATKHVGHRLDGADRMLALAIVAIALVGAVLLAMVPGFAGVRVDGSAVPGPTPAPASIVVESAR